ncbi:MAG: hypothetical protein NTY91_03980 [Euryarchaeota archaeon]|jgi:hypothetical protein|nr:hypothetical protein [Euryarchaeota archaeon]
MNGRIILGSILAVFLIALVPATNAIQTQTVEREVSRTLVSYEQLKNMDAEALVAYIQILTNDYPELSEKFTNAVEDIENTPISPNNANHQNNFLIEKNKGPKQRDDNQTFLEKIFWKIYNYRVFRLLVSLLLFINFQSKFTLMRTMTWGIRLLRWVKVGILLGFIDPSQQPPQTPDIGFQQDFGNDTLTVTYVTAIDVLWSDISEIGAGSCDPFPEGNVTAGDMITNCTGIIVMQYIPTYEVLGVFEFD